MIFHYFYKDKEETIDTWNFPSGFGFLGANAEEHIVGFAIIRKEENGKIGVYGIDDTGKFNQGQEDVLDWIDVNVSWLVRDNLILDEQSAGVELIPTLDFENDPDNAATYIPNGFIKSCRVIKELNPEGGGGGDGDDGEGGDDSGGGGTPPNPYLEFRTVELAFTSSLSGDLPPALLDEGGNLLKPLTYRGSFDIRSSEAYSSFVRSAASYLMGAYQGLYASSRSYIEDVQTPSHLRGNEGWRIDVTGPVSFYISVGSDVYYDGAGMDKVYSGTYYHLSERFNVLNEDGGIESDDNSMYMPAGKIFITL